MWLQQCLSCSSFLTSPAVVLKTQMSAWVSWKLNFLQNPCKALCCVSRRVEIVSQWQICVIVLRWTASGMNIPSCSVLLWESLGFQLRQSVCFSLSIFPFLVVLLFLFGSHCLLGRADLWVWCPGSVWLLHQQSCQQALGNQNQHEQSRCEDELLFLFGRWDLRRRNYDHPSHWKKDVFCVTT